MPREIITLQASDTCLPGLACPPDCHFRPDSNPACPPTGVYHCDCLSLPIRRRCRWDNAGIRSGQSSGETQAALSANPCDCAVSDPGWYRGSWSGERFAWSTGSPRRESSRSLRLMVLIAKTSSSTRRTMMSSHWAPLTCFTFRFVANPEHIIDYRTRESLIMSVTLMSFCLLTILSHLTTCFRSFYF